MARIPHTPGLQASNLEQGETEEEGNVIDWSQGKLPKGQQDGIKFRRCKNVLPTHSCSEKAICLEHFSKDSQLHLGAWRVRLPTRCNVTSIDVGSISVENALFDSGKEGSNLALQALQHQRPIIGPWPNEIFQQVGLSWILFWLCLVSHVEHVSRTLLAAGFALACLALPITWPLKILCWMWSREKCVIPKLPILPETLVVSPFSSPDICPVLPNEPRTANTCQRMPIGS